MKLQDEGNPSEDFTYAIALKCLCIWVYINVNFLIF